MELLQEESNDYERKQGFLESVFLECKIIAMHMLSFYKRREKILTTLMLLK